MGKELGVESQLCRSIDINGLTIWPRQSRQENDRSRGVDGQICHLLQQEMSVASSFLDALIANGLFLLNKCYDYNEVNRKRASVRSAWIFFA